MSNMIKAYSIRYEEELKKTIDTHLKLDKEIEGKRIKVASIEAKRDEFVEGLQALVVEQLPSYEEQKIISGKLIEEAKTEAENILKHAKQEAERIKKEAFETAQKKGFEEGMKQSNRQAQKLVDEFEEKNTQLQKKYQAMVTELEPRMVEIMSSLIEYITGILVEDKEEVILYLVEKTLKNVDKSSEYTILVAKENYEYLSEKKNILLGAFGREVSLFITEDSSLKRNQCRIETDLKVIDCSLDIQLNNLIKDLKLLGGI